MLNAASFPRPAIPTRYRAPLARMSNRVVTDGAVHIASPLNLPSSMPEHASQLYARNVLSLLELMSGEEGALELDFEDEIIKGACVTRDGEIVHEGAKKTVEGATA